MKYAEQLSEKILIKSLEEHFRSLKEQGLIVDWQMEPDGSFRVLPKRPVLFIPMKFVIEGQRHE